MGQDIPAEISVPTGAGVHGEHGEHGKHGTSLADAGLTGADVTRDVELPATPATGPRGGVGEPVKAPGLICKGQEGKAVDPHQPEALCGDVRQVVGPAVEQVRNLVGPAAPPAGTPKIAAKRADQPTADVAGDQLHDAQDPDRHLAVHTTDVGDGALAVVSDQAWEWMQPLLPGSPGRRCRDHRQVIEAICWKYRTGSPWRGLPARFGPWQTAYHRLTRWSADGTWARLLARAQTDRVAAGELDWLVAIDSTAVRVQQHAASPRRVGGNAAPTSPCEPEHGVAA